MDRAPLAKAVSASAVELPSRAKQHAQNSSTADVVRLRLSTDQTSSSQSPVSFPPRENGQDLESGRTSPSGGEKRHLHGRNGLVAVAEQRVDVELRSLEQRMKEMVSSARVHLLTHLEQHRKEFRCIYMLR